MGLGKQQEKVGEFGMGQRMALCEHDVAQFPAGGEQVAESPDVLLSLGKCVASGPRWGRRPGEQELAAALTQGVQDTG